MSKRAPSGKDLMPETAAAMTSKANATANTPNLSTQVVEETPRFDSSAFRDAWQSQAGLEAEHLNLAGMVAPNGMASLNQIRMDLQPVANQLAAVRIPDTRVNIGGIKMEIPFAIKQYANDLDQSAYTKVLKFLVGKERLLSVRNHSARANQLNTPALWLNQAIAVETKKPYVFLLRQQLADTLSTVPKIAEESNRKAEELMIAALGGGLFQPIAHIANANQLTPYTVFILLVDQILSDREATSVPVASSAIWDHDDDDDEAMIS